MRHIESLKSRRTSEGRTCLSPGLVGALFCVMILTGCSQQETNLFGDSDRWKIFSSKSTSEESDVLAPVAINEEDEDSDEYFDTDPESKTAEEQVAEQIERLRHALQQSGDKEISPIAPNQPFVAETDSIAAKITESEMMTERSAAVTISPPEIAPQPSVEQHHLVEPKPQTIQITSIEPVPVPQENPPAPQIPAKNQPEDPPGFEPIGLSAANVQVRLNLPELNDPSSALDNLLRQLEQKLSDRPEDTATQIKLHLVHAILGQWQQAFDENENLEFGGGDLAINLARLVKVFDDDELNSAQQANEALIIVEQVQGWLRRQADLVIRNIQICREVSSFGNFKVMPDNYFVAGRRLPIIIYLELENFNSKFLDDQGVYQTLLSLTIEALDESGKVNWRQHYEKIEDTSNRHRRDFYLAPPITLPATLSAGKLGLKVTIEDLHGNKVAQRILDLELYPER